LDPSAEPVLEYFMKLRLSIFDGIQAQLTPNEQRLLETTFQILKEYSNDSMTQ
jgi:hypothetical protein